MNSPTTIKARPKRPNHGPLFSSRWIFSKKRWALWMNDRGREEYEQFLVAFDGQPVKILTKRFRSLLRRALKHRDRDAVHQAALVGLLNAVRCWKPDGGAGLNTTAMYHISMSVSRELNGGVDQRSRQRVSHLSEMDDETGFGLLSVLAVEEADTGPSAEEVDGLNRLLRKIPERERNILTARIVNGRSLDEIGIDIGLSKERVRQLQVRALRKLRQLAAGGEPTAETAVEKKAKRGGNSTEVQNIRRIREGNVRATLARTPGLTVYQIAEATLLAENTVLNILKRGRKAEPPVYRSEGESRRFSTTPVRWFLTDQQS